MTPDPWINLALRAPTACSGWPAEHIILRPRRERLVPDQRLNEMAIRALRPISLALELGQKAAIVETESPWSAQFAEAAMGRRG